MQIPFPEAVTPPLPGAPPTGSVTRRGLDWLLNSGIQQPAGGVARFCRTDAWEYQPVSVEITGYLVSTLVYFHRATGDPQYLDAALRAGRYLAGTAWRPDLATMPFEPHPEGGLAYFFDLGIVARGLLALWRATGAEEFRERAVACARSMAEDFRGPAGFHPVLELPGKRPVAGNGRWSRHPGCYQLKAALGWHDAAAAGAGDHYRALYEEALERALATHEGFLDEEPEQDRVVDRLHAYCYFLEGLLARAQRAVCLRALAEGIGRTGRLLRQARSGFERSDVWAQLLRLRLYAGALGALPLDARLAREEAAAIPGFQSRAADRRAAGGFVFGRKAGAAMPFVNPVSTVFAIQALAQWEQHRAGCFRAELDELI